jgi:hypothetical protein
VAKHPRKWSDQVKYEFIDAFCGKHLGGGIAREVYEVLGQPDQVAKVEQRSGSFQNVLESEIWQAVMFTKWARWFAPVIRISSSGIVLIQAKTAPLPPDRHPRELPNFFTDLKPENFGLFEGRVVCHDYALSMFTSEAIGRARMRKVAPEKFARGCG